MIYGIWYGGASYAMGELAECLEVFDSIRQAKDAFYDRAHLGYSLRCNFRYADGRDEWVHTPAVAIATAEDGGPEIHLFYSDPRESHDPYPDRIIAFGPREGIVVQVA